ncbi:hypothetical protein [Scytonema sp. PCC 10023]
MFTVKKLSLMTLATCSTVLSMGSVDTALAYRVAVSTYQWSCW